MELKFTQFHLDYMKDAGGRVLDFAAINDKYVDNKNVYKKMGANVLEFLNMTSVGDMLNDILKDVDFIVDETAHGYIPSGSLLA